MLAGGFNLVHDAEHFTPHDHENIHPLPTPPFPSTYIPQLYTEI